MIFKDLIQYIENDIGLCGKTKEFMERYLLNAVLSYIEEREQERILSMRYDEWLELNSNNIGEVLDKIVDHVNKFALACRDESLSEEEVKNLHQFLKPSTVVDALCKLYSNGIYDAEYSRYIVIRDASPSNCRSELIRKLNSNENIEVRSRFIDIAKDLFLVKRRFPDKSSFEAYPLVDRVFAYAEPRNVPLGKVRSDEVFNKIKDYVVKIYRLYNMQILRRSPSENEVQILQSILRSFFSKLNILFYEFQVEGIKRLLENILTALKDNRTSISIVEAPTGSGKTEIFILTTLILALVKRLSLSYLNSAQRNPPIAILIYPRQALAANQIDRLLKYLYELNNEIDRYFRTAETKPFVTLSINYGEVRFKDEYEKLVKLNINEVLSEGYVRNPKRPKGYKGTSMPALRYCGRDIVFVELEYFKCPDGSAPKLIYDMRNQRLILDKVVCGEDELPYVKVVKDVIKESPGDIHITLFETLRLNLLSKTWRDIFGNQELRGPLLFVLDEIHTYVGIRGARYAYALRRVLARIAEQTGRKGFVIVGVSATLPNPEEFVGDLFLIGNGIIGQVKPSFIRPKISEVIPLGNEYFFITVPTTKYPVDSLSVSIQTVMTLFYNTPALPEGDDYVKKAFLFVDNLDIVRRFRSDLSNAVRRKGPSGECKDSIFGLQDLRNVMSTCFNQAIKDYGDTSLEDRSNFRIERLDSYESWRNGELWWGYTLEYQKTGKRFDEVTEYTSKHKGDINKPLIVTTSALEVGVDYKDVILIYQHGMPPNLSALIQRAGRAGRRVFENPLIRTVVAVQLSPEVPTQATYFEILTRVKTLRDALKYDRLYVSTKNKYVIKQTLVEAILDYLILKNNTIKTLISDVLEFECDSFLNSLKTCWNQNRRDLLAYLKLIFPKQEELSNYIEELIDFMEEECRKLRGGGP